jgi:hypothetical protein
MVRDDDNIDMHVVNECVRAGADECGQIVALLYCGDWCDTKDEHEHRFQALLSELPAVRDSHEKRKLVVALRLYCQLRWAAFRDDLTSMIPLTDIIRAKLADAVERFLDTEGSLRGTHFLEFAVTLFDNEDFISRILANGVEKFELNRALLRAAETCRSDRVEMLLRHGADPNGRAVYEDQKEERYVQRLVTPLNMACKGVHLPGQRTTILTLVEKGADITVNGGLPLAIAFQKCDTELVGKMMSAGAHPRDIATGNLRRILSAPDSALLYLHALERGGI